MQDIYILQIFARNNIYKESKLTCYILIILQALLKIALNKYFYILIFLLYFVILVFLTKILEKIIILKRFINIFRQYKQLLNNKNCNFGNYNNK